MLEMGNGYFGQKKTGFIIKTNLLELAWCTAAQLTVSVFGEFNTRSFDFCLFLSLLSHLKANLIGAWI